MSDIISVSTAQELEQALQHANGGETIELAGGDYGDLDLLTFKKFGVKAIYDTPVTITSADPEDRASFSGMDLREVKNLTFDNVVFDSDYSGGDVWVGPFKIANSEGITIRNSLIEGELASGTGDPTADGFATGKGLRVSSSSDIVIENNEFTTWHRGMVISGSTDVQVTGNDVHSMRSDGMNFSQVERVLIEDNHIHDFKRSMSSSDHSDMIQFWTNGTSRPSTDIVIRGNTLDVGDGKTQSIFMRNDQVDRGFAGEEMFYRNLLIEENVILNNHVHGIAVGETNGLVIRKNSVLDADAENTSSVATPIIKVKPASMDVVITQNATAGISGQRGQPDWTVSDNALIQNADLNAPGHYGAEFIHSSMSGAANAYLPDPDGTVAQLDAGASRLRLDTAPDEIMVAFDVSSVPDDNNSVVFDAAHTYGPTGALGPDDAPLFVWDFGDGTGATGQVVRHSFAEAGRYETTLTVVTPDGETASTKGKIALKGTEMLSFDPQTGIFETEKYGDTMVIDHSDRGSVETQSGYGVDLGDRGTATRVDEAHLARLFGAESFDMSMTLRADTPGSTGEVALSFLNFLISIENRGEVGFKLWTDKEAKKLTTSGVTVNDGQDHDVRISFDSEESRLEIHVDDTLAAATEIEGAMRANNPRPLMFGNPWGKENFDGTLTAFDLDVGNQDYPDYAGDVTAVPTDESRGATAPEEEASPSISAPFAVFADLQADRLEVTIDETLAGDTAAPATQEQAPETISLIGSVRSDAIWAAQTVHDDDVLDDPGTMDVFVEEAPVL